MAVAPVAVTVVAVAGAPPAALVPVAVAPPALLLPPPMAVAPGAVLHVAVCTHRRGSVRGDRVPAACGTGDCGHGTGARGRRVKKTDPIEFYLTSIQSQYSIWEAISEYTYLHYSI